jgi:5'-AMP-activated protein kinase regulatory beta subunit
VSIVGDWSLWQKKEAMNRKTLSNGDRYFQIQLALTEGRHEYKYFIDGKWTHDRSAPRIGNSFGGWNNVVEVV